MLKLSIVAWLTLSGADAGTTAVALHNGAREINPLIAPNPAILLPMTKIGTTTAGLYVVDRLVKTRHRGTAIFLAVSQAVVYGFVVRHNLNVIESEKGSK